MIQQGKIVLKHTMVSIFGGGVVIHIVSVDRNYGTSSERKYEGNI